MGIRGEGRQGRQGRQGDKGDKGIYSPIVHWAELLIMFTKPHNTLL
nr:hypothetical protein [Chroococcidiopsis cubana]